MTTKYHSLNDRLQQNMDRLTNWVWFPDDNDVPALFRFLRAILRIGYIIVREFKRDRITLRASALTFTVVLSLVPMLALGTAVLKGLGAGDQMRQAAYRFIEQVDDSPLPPEGTPPSSGSQAAPQMGSGLSSSPESPTADPATSDGLTSHLRKAVDQIFDYVDRTDFAALGAFGILGLVIAAISVLGSIEQSMNTIWQAENNRPLSRKVIDYLALMILLPVTVNLGLATEATLQSPALLGYLHNLLPVLWLGKLLLKMLPILAVIATFSILYRFLPNVRVAMFPALAGGIFGGLSWMLVQILYVKLQIGVARYNAIYGSFATLPLFLVWLYVAWIVFLTGAETAFAAQVRNSYQWRDVILTPVARLTIAFKIMTAVLTDFRQGKTINRTQLANRLNYPYPAISEVAEELVTTGKLRPVTDEKNGYVPAAPAEAIEPAEFIDLFFGNEEQANGNELAIYALRAARKSLAGKKIQ